MRKILLISLFFVFAALLPQPVYAAGGTSDDTFVGYLTQQTESFLTSHIASVLHTVERSLASLGKIEVDFTLSLTHPFTAPKRTETAATNQYGDSQPSSPAIGHVLTPTNKPSISPDATQQGNALPFQSPVSPSDIITSTVSNLLHNSSFEVQITGQPTDWNYQLDSNTGNTFISQEGNRSGKFGLKFVGSNTGNFGISQPDVKTVPGRAYNFSAYIKLTNAPTITVKLGFWNENLNTEGEMKTVTLSGTKDWTRISMSTTTPGLITDPKNEFPIIEVLGLTSGAVYLDDAQLTEGSALAEYNSSLGYPSSQAVGDGSVIFTPSGDIYPTYPGSGSLGSPTNQFSSLNLTNASIDTNGNLNLKGGGTVNSGLTVGGSLTVNGNTTFTGSNTFNNPLIFTAYGTGLLHTDSHGNVTSNAVNLATGDISGVLNVGNGGTGTTSLPANGVLLGNGSSALSALTPGNSGYILQSNGTGSTPSWVAPSGLSAGSIPFSGITSGTNISASMLVGNGASLAYTGTGILNANQLLGGTWAIPGAIGGATPNTGSFTTLSGTAVTGTTFNGLNIANNGTNTLNIATGKSLGINNNLTFGGTDGTTFTFPATTGNVITSSNLSAITQTGTIASGTWNGTAIGTQYGGTGQNWSSVAQGNIPYFSSTGTLATLAPNTAGYILQTNGTSANPSWVAPSSITAGSIPFSGITSGTNTTAAMTIGTGASLTYNGGTATSGVINANQLLGNTWAAPSAIGNTTANTGAFTTLSTSGDIAANSGNITTTQTTANLFNTTATTLNIAGAATTIGIGSSTGTTTVNNNLSVTGNLQVKGGNPWYDVKAYGAKGDGTTDDTTAIQNAINAEAGSGGTVFFPIGTYKVTSTITATNPVTITGAGYGSYITGAFNGSLIWVHDTADVNIEKIHFANTFVYDGVSTAWKDILFDRSTNSSVDSSFFTAGEGAVSFGTSHRMIFSHNYVSTMSDFGFSGYTQVGSTNASGYIITNNTFLNDKTVIVSYGPSHDINLEDVDDALVENNYISENAGFTETNASAIKIAVQINSSVNHNIIKGNTMVQSPVGPDVGILVGGPYNDLLVEGNEINGYRVGIQNTQITAGNLNGVTIDGNNINVATSSAGGSYGIYYTARGSSASVGAVGLHITNNSIEGPGWISGIFGHGIEVDLMDSVSIQGNRVSNNPYSGISVQGSQKDTIENNITYDNDISTSSSTDSAGLSLASLAGVSPDNNTITGNSSYDDQLTPTQRYGLYIIGNNNYIAGNSTKNNVTQQIFASAGNTLGINYTNDGSLVTNNTDGSLSLAGGGTNSNITFTPNGTGSVLINELSTGSILAASSSGIPRFTINNDGSINVGLGNTTAVNLSGAGSGTGFYLNGNLRMTDNYSSGFTIFKPQGSTLGIKDGSTNQAIQVFSSGTNYLNLSANGNGSYVGSGGNSVLSLQPFASGSYSGAVAIGTQSPLGQTGLDIEKTVGNEALLVNQIGSGPILTASQGGSLKFIINNSGQVGIGTASPLANSGLHVGVNSKGNATLVVDNTGGQGDLFTASSSGSPKFVINSSGNVGIGTNSPSDVLSVNGNVTITGGNSKYFYNANSGNVVKELFNGSGDWLGLQSDAANIFSISDKNANTSTLGGAVLSLKLNGNGTGGNVGINTTSPNYRLDTIDTQNATSAASITNLSISDTANTNVLALNLGTATSGTNSRFIQFYAGANSSNKGIGVGRIQLNNGNVAYNTGGADFAEYFSKGTTPLSQGDIVTVGSDGNTTLATQKIGAIGIISTTAGFIGNAPHDPTQEQQKVVVGLVGQLPVKVTTENGNIQPGDLLALSSRPGVAMKATKAGVTIGKALGGYNNTDPLAVGTIQVLINISWADPTITITDSGNLAVSGQPLDTTPLALPITPQANTGSSLATQATPPLSPDQYQQLNASVTSLQQQYASFSAQMINPQTITDLTNRVASLEKMFPTMTSLPLTSLSSQDATISGTLSVSGRTVLSDVGITGKLIMGLLSINGLDTDQSGSTSATINTLSGPLKLQSMALASIDMFNGKVTIDTSGNIKTTGIVTAKKYNVDTSDNASTSVGEAVIPAGQTSIEVKTTAVTNLSQIFTSPEEPLDFSLGIVHKEPGALFTVEITKPAQQDIKFSWWIIN